MVEQSNIKKLKRTDLLQLLITQGKEAEELQKKLEEKEKQLKAEIEEREKLRAELEEKEKQLQAELEEKEKALTTELVEKEEQIKKEIEEKDRLLHDKTIAIEKTGSIAEAALLLNGVFQAAEAAAKQYLDNIKQRSKEQDEICQRKLEEAQQKADEIVSQAEEQKLQSQKEAENYWEDISGRLSRFYEEHQSLREILQYEKK